MIAACPKCHTRYRLKSEQLSGDGAKLRCRRCSAIFRVRSPRAAPAPEQTAPREEPSGASSRKPEPAPAAPPPSGPRVVLAMPETDNAEGPKRWVGALQRWGLAVQLIHDGVEAILAIQREIPRAVVTHASLDRMSGLELCELMKRNESLRKIPFILIASQADAEELAAVEAGRFGADAYLERGSAPEALHDRLERLGVPLGESSPVPRFASPRGAAAVADAPPIPPVTPPAQPHDPPGEGGDLSEARVRAERLARIAVSDIVLYNEGKFVAAVERGDVLEAMRDELEEGRSLLRGRVPAPVFAERDYMGDELARIARIRSEAD